MTFLKFHLCKKRHFTLVIFFAEKVEQFIPPKKGKSHILRIIREVLAFQPNSKKTNIAVALEYFNSVIKKRSICFILSDFISPAFDKPLKIASKKHDIIGVRIHDKREDNLPNIGLIPILLFDKAQSRSFEKFEDLIHSNFEIHYKSHY